MARRQHPPVVFQAGLRELAFLRFDARPLDGEAVRVEAQFRQQGDIFGIAVVVVAGVAGRFSVDGSRHVFKQPIVAVDVVPLDLVCGGGRAPQESVWKFHVFAPSKRTAK